MSKPRLYKMTVRKKVESCGTKCPNYVTHWYNMPRCKAIGEVNPRIKTFPRNCPLKIISEIEGDEYE